MKQRGECFDYSVNIREPDMLQLTPSTLIQVVVNKTEQAPDRANIDKRSVVKFGGCASQVD